MKKKVDHRKLCQVISDLYYAHEVIEKVAESRDGVGAGSGAERVGIPEQQALMKEVLKAARADFESERREHVSFIEQSLVNVLISCGRNPRSARFDVVPGGGP